MKKIWFLVLALGSLTAACGKGGPACPEGAYKDPGGRFCAALPAGYAASDQPAGLNIVKIAKDSNSVSLQFLPAGDYDHQVAALKADATSDKDRVIKSEGELSGGRGRTQLYVMSKINYENLGTVTKGSKNVVLCRGSHSAPMPKEYIDICQNLILP